MRRILIIAFLIMVLIGVLITFIWYVVRVPNKDEPEKLNNISKNAVWKGSSEEGFWFELIKIDSVNKVWRFRIYNDYSGQLMADADFVKMADCKYELPLSDEIFNDILYFEFDKIEIKNGCNLLMLKPIHNGILKQVGN